MTKRIVVLAFLAVLVMQTAILYELTQHVHLGAQALALQALQPSVKESPGKYHGIVPASLEEPAPEPTPVPRFIEEADAMTATGPNGMPPPLMLTPIIDLELKTVSYILRDKDGKVVGFHVVRFEVEESCPMEKSDSRTAKLVF